MKLTKLSDFIKGLIQFALRLQRARYIQMILNAGLRAGRVLS
jgi:hypothetical protein